MRQRSLFIILCIIVATIVTGCSSARKENPEATPTSMPKLSADVITQATNYGGVLLGQFGALESVMGRYDELLNDPRLTAADWKILVGSQNKVIDLVYAAVSNMTPPEALKATHAAALDAVGDCLAARQTVQAAMDAVDANQLGKAAEQAKSCKTKLSAVETELNAIATANNIKLNEIPMTSGLERAAEAPAAAASGEAVTATGVVVDTSNLRAGPGTNYGKVGSLTKGAAITVIGRNEAGDWLVVQTPTIPQAWIAAFLLNGVGDVQSLPVVRAPP